MKIKGLAIVTDGSQSKDISIDVPDDISSLPSHKLSIIGDNVVLLVPNKDDFLESIKRKIVSYQNKLIGTEDSHELERYRVNAEAADGVIAGNIHPQILAAFTDFFNSLKDKNPEKFAGFTVDTFAKWIQIKQLTSKSGVLLISALANSYEQQIKTANNADIESLYEQLMANAKERYNQGLLLASSQMYLAGCIDLESLFFLQKEANKQKKEINELAVEATAD